MLEWGVIQQKPSNCTPPSLPPSLPQLLTDGLPLSERGRDRLDFPLVLVHAPTGLLGRWRKRRVKREGVGEGARMRVMSVLSHQKEALQTLSRTTSGSKPGGGEGEEERG